MMNHLKASEAGKKQAEREMRCGWRAGKGQIMGPLTQCKQFGFYSKGNS